MSESLQGEAGEGGFFAVYPASEEAQTAHHIEFQYAGMVHQAETGMAGMWLFLATELLFFGGLFFIAAVYWERFAAAIRHASAHAEFGIGTINTAILLCSSAIFTWGVGRARLGDNRGLLRASVATALLGSAFLVLKLFEWHDDFDAHLFPGTEFALTGAGEGPAKIFWSFYFLATFLHGLHMMVGIGLVTWIGWSAHRRRFTPAYATPPEAVGLYWSFVDMMWLCLYPLIYLPGRAL